MIVVKCLEKIRNKSGVISGYKLIDQQGQEKVLSSKDLKSAIASNQIQVVNLSLTKDNRLVDKGVKSINNKHTKYCMFTREMVNLIDSPKVLKFKSNQNLRQLVKSAKSQGCLIKKLSTDMVSIETESSILIASDKKIRLDNTIPIQRNYEYEGLFSRTKFSEIDLRDTDSSKVRDMSFMFAYCKARELNLSELDTSNVIDMDFMFCNCNARELDLRNFNTSNVRSMKSMFLDKTFLESVNKCKVKHINLSSFNTSNVENMTSMFMGCKVERLDLRYFNTDRVKSMASMFDHCSTPVLDLNSFNTSRVKDMSYMFNGCNVKELYMDRFNTSEVMTMEGMFHECKAESLDLSHFNTSKVENMEGMFNGCKAQVKTNDTKIKKAIASRK